MLTWPELLLRERAGGDSDWWLGYNRAKVDGPGHAYDSF
jgi:hypothetical protein